MPNVLIRNIDPHTLHQLKAMAVAHGRSLPAELKTIVERAVRSSDIQVKHRLQRLDDLFAGRWFDDSAKLIREDRDR